MCRSPSRTRTAGYGAIEGYFCVGGPYLLAGILEVSGTIVLYSAPSRRGFQGQEAQPKCDLLRAPRRQERRARRCSDFSIVGTKFCLQHNFGDRKAQQRRRRHDMSLARPFKSKPLGLIAALSKTGRKRWKRNKLCSHTYCTRLTVKLRAEKLEVLLS